MEPVFGKDRVGRADYQMLSFLELIEVVTVARFRRESRVRLETLRSAHAFAREHLLTPFPFASLKLQQFGGHVLSEFQEQDGVESRLVALDMHGQWILPGLVQDLLSDLDFDNEDKLARRWFLFGRSARIVVDPHLAAGQPVIEGTRVPIRVVRDRFRAGDSIALIADDLELTPSMVEDLLRIAA